MDGLQGRLFLYVIIVLSAIIHEYAHAWAAAREGDLTAKYAGRLTLNPLAHIDLWGTVILPLFLLLFFGVFFGYAKPVPINPYNFRDQKRGIIWVSLAGVAANLAVAVVIGLIIRFYPDFYAVGALASIVLVNIWLLLFNLLPFPPLDGSKLFEAIGGRSGKFSIFTQNPFGIIIAIIVAMYFIPMVIPFIFRLITGFGI
ncbi:MAG: Peptidase M50 [Parcubacteria group bacterium GW2011_GWB1_42_6]|nr:MAG: Peptidase M50 [Parcubacteria group bacterium GW2011_GWB1_42_6]